jgi:hypothetical protein
MGRMPPDFRAAEGPDEMCRLWIEGGFGSEQFGRLRCVVTHANLEPAVAVEASESADFRAARRFHLAGHGARRSSNRGRLDHGDRGVPAG